MLFREIETAHSALRGSHRVIQMHWGGGTPTFLSPDQIGELAEFCFERFDFASDAEISIEVNPVVTKKEHLEVLSRLGFNRISMGVQDFDPLVQDKINRHQSFELTENLVKASRALGFESVNLDLVYGLPRQNLKTFTETIEQVLKLRPERLAVYSFAKVPWKQPFQRRFLDSELPDGLQKIQLYLCARERLTAAGYDVIGMDHFALPNDELAVAARERTLHRNFMGYTTKPDSELLGLGVSAISSVGSLFGQNAKTLPSYYKLIEKFGLATVLGHHLSSEDTLRRKVILNLMCNFEVNFKEIQESFGVDFKEHFKKEWPELEEFERQEMLVIEPSKLLVVGRGQILVRNIAMAFDQYLSADASQRKFSNTI
jgi:oxygen-independent coproporphyrinogen-3 oxidase